MRFYRRFSYAEIATVCLVALILIGMSGPAYLSIRSSPRWLHCQNNMRQCLVAMHNYESANGHFPPAWTVDEQGNKTHCWRVLILPFIDEQALYDQYDFNEPWDGPNNSKLANQMPQVYQCPSAPNSKNETPYKLVSDPAAFFDGDSRRGLKDVVEDASSMIVMVEDSNVVNWMKPDGISIEDAIHCLSTEGRHCSCEDNRYYRIFHGVNIGTLDTVVHRAKPKTNPELFRRGLRFADGHAPDLANFTGQRVVYKPQVFLALVVYLVLLALPSWFLKKPLIPAP